MSPVDATSPTAAEHLTFETTRFGDVTVDASAVIDFPRGLVGMPAARRFAFLHPEKDDDAATSFFWLQSLDDPALAFVACDPREFFDGYDVPVGNEEQEVLGIEKPEDGVVCVILVVPSNPRDITANLRGPLVVNPRHSVGVQLVLGESQPVNARLFDEDGGELPCSS